MKFSIKENQNTLKSKDKYIKDDYFNLLVTLAIENHNDYHIHEVIKNLFDLYNLNDYKLFFENYLLANKRYSENIFEIYDLFCEWKPFDYYNLRNCKGAFLEEFVFNLFEKNV